MNDADLSKLDGSSAQAAVPAEAGSLTPLARAVEIIAAEIYDGDRRPPTVSRTELFNALAYTLSALSPMFVVDSKPPRRLSEQELGNARFRSGGAEMYFSDGRPPLREVAVTTDGIARVVRILKESPPGR